MTHPVKGLHVAIRFDPSNGLWHWRMVSEEGHLLNRSREFVDRTECELEALEENLPIAGLSRSIAQTRRVRASPKRTL